MIFFMLKKKILFHLFVSLEPSLPSDTIVTILDTILNKNSQEPLIVPQIDKLTFYEKHI